MKILKYMLILTGLIFAMPGCETYPEFEQDNSVTYPVNGEWWVTYKYDDGTGNVDDHYGAGYTILYTYNTSSNAKDKIWIDDQGNFWDFKVKADLDLNSRTFNIAEGEDITYNDTTTILNGQVIELEDGDSIYMEIEWASDPGVIYVCSGRRVKGFTKNGKGSKSYEADYGN